MAPRVIQASAAKAAPAKAVIKKNLAKLPAGKKVADITAPDYWEQA